MWRYPNTILIRLNCLIYFFALTNACAIYEPPTVTIKNGTLTGKIMHTRLKNEIYAYEGIPYAAPPVGQLRFKPPQPASAWYEKRQAMKVPKFCIEIDAFQVQNYITGDEDCLYLNVYTPNFQKYSLIQYPVMIWFHGGGWTSGGGYYFQPDYLLDHDVVLVTVNYRLGPFGFLSTEDLECPGNLGLKDQQQALRWVQENIAYFYGDPENVTIFGQSAGGASVHYHMVSPLSKGLFHRAISQSGTFYSSWALTPPGFAKENAKTLGNYLNCTTENSKELIECLLTKRAREIASVNRIFKILNYGQLMPFRPVIEREHSGAFLTEDPLISVREGRIADVPWMTGITSEEGSMIASFIYGHKLVKHFNDEFMQVAPLTLLYQEIYQLVDQKFIDEITKTIREYYFGQNNIDESDEARFNVINMYGDTWFNHGTYMAVRDFIVNQTSPLYYYYFAYRGKTSFSSVFGDSNRNYGVSHADDVQYLFPVDKSLFRNELSKDDENMIDLLTTLWCNFAKFGNPTPENMELIPVKWTPSVTNQSLEYLHIISTQNISMENELLTDRMSFWDSLEDQIKCVG